MLILRNIELVQTILIFQLRYCEWLSDCFFVSEAILRKAFSCDILICDAECVGQSLWLEIFKVKSFWLSVCLSVCRSIYLPVYFYLFIRSFVHTFVRSFILPFIVYLLVNSPIWKQAYRSYLSTKATKSELTRITISDTRSCCACVACHEAQIKCDNTGRCIDGARYFCDGGDDCGDGSDEPVNCSEW